MDFRLVSKVHFAAWCIYCKLTVHVVNDLVSNSAIVLQDVEVLSTDCGGNLLCNREELGQSVIRNICELCTMVLRDNKLTQAQSVQKTRDADIWPY